MEKHRLKHFGNVGRIRSTLFHSKEAKINVLLFHSGLNFWGEVPIQMAHVQIGMVGTEQTGVLLTGEMPCGYMAAFGNDECAKKVTQH
jgi:hypothetical protein